MNEGRKEGRKKGRTGGRKGVGNALRKEGGNVLFFFSISET